MMKSSSLLVAFAMINCNRRDGSARAVNEVAERLATRGHRVDVFARAVEDLDLSGIRWRRMPGVPWPDFLDFTTYHFLADVRIRRQNYDIIHSIGNNALAANVITIQNIQPAKRAFMDRVLREEKTSLARKVAKWLYLEITTAVEKRVYTQRPGRKPPLFLPVSRGVEAELRAHYDIGDAPVKIIPNAADTAVFHPLSPAERAAWRNAHGFAEADVLCLFSGGEWARKGLELGLRALARIEQQNVKLVVAGEDADRPRYEKMAADLGVADRVRFLGFRRDINTVMGAADLFLFPSYYEAFSLATIEAAACGLPVVGAKINGTEDFIQSGRTGEFVAHDAESIATVLTPLVADHQRLRSMGEDARRLVEQNYTWERVTTLTEEAYREYLDALGTPIQTS